MLITKDQGESWQAERKSLTAHRNFSVLISRYGKAKDRKLYSKQIRFSPVKKADSFVSSNILMVLL